MQRKAIYDLIRLIDTAHTPNKLLVSTLEAKNGTLRRQLAEAKKLGQLDACKLMQQRALQGRSVHDLVKLIDTARTPTVLRVSTLEAENDTLKRQLAEARKARPAGDVDSSGSSEDDARAKAEATARQRELEMVADVPNPINEYVEMLEEEVSSMQLEWC